MKTILVTGATDGIGLQTATELAARGHRVLVHGRSTQRIDRAIGLIRRTSPDAALVPVRADLARLDEVRALAAEVALLAPSLDVLLHNAGIYANQREETVDGFESTIAVNHLAPHLLTHLLLPHLRGGRVLVLSSIAHTRASLRTGDLNMREGWSPYGSYASSKLANVLFVRELARRLGPTPQVFALHPGVVSTKLLVQGFGMHGQDSLADGAATSVLLADSAVLEGTGEYWSGGRRSTPSATARDPKLARDLYERSCQLVGVEPLPEPPH
jgi:NAD(P)-dependent dehydrogenase (short-subunit alcohol dehydrogenase family)